MVDAGVCFGDTAVCFSKCAGPDGAVYGFDPLGTHLEIARHNVAQNDFATNVRFYPYGLGAQDSPGAPDLGAVDPGHCVSDTTAIRTIDSMVADGSIPRVDFIKMDIEGYEGAALEGARQVIAKFKPKLAISIYHKPEDYFEIMEKIIDINDDYDFYMENYTICDGETILYGIDRSRNAAPR